LDFGFNGGAVCWIGYGAFGGEDGRSGDFLNRYREGLVVEAAAAVGDTDGDGVVADVGGSGSPAEFSGGGAQGQGWRGGNDGINGDVAVLVDGGEVVGVFGADPGDLIWGAGEADGDVGGREADGEGPYLGGDVGGVGLAVGGGDGPVIGCIVGEVGKVEVFGCGGLGCDGAVGEGTVGVMDGVC